MTGQILSNIRQFAASQAAPIPAGLIDVAYIDGAACAAAGAMSISQWLSLVKDREAPQPVIRRPCKTPNPMK